MSSLPAPPDVPANGNADQTDTYSIPTLNKTTGAAGTLLGARKDQISSQDSAAGGPDMSSTAPPPSNLPYANTMRAISPQRPIPSDQRAATSSSPPNSMSIAVNSSRVRSASPGLHSPASSLIFERNVQEHALPEDLSHKLPAHIQTEDYIPPVLEASSIAITDEHLKPDDVEILTHSMHQPAVVPASSGSGVDSGTISPHEETAPSSLPVPPIAEPDEKESTYGSIDPTDVRRLSFISFADVVQGEHAQDNIRESVLHMSLSEANRSPSPSARSPVSIQGFGGPSPPTSGTPSLHGMETVGMSKVPIMPGSPLSLGQQSPTLLGGATGTLGGGEVMVEKMSEALRKPGSGDLLAGMGHSPSSAALNEGTQMGTTSK